MPNKYPDSYYLQQSYQGQNQSYGFNQQNQIMYETLYPKYPSFEPVDNWLPDPQMVSDIEKGLRLTEKMETIEISSKDLSPSSCCSNIDLLLPDLYKNNTQWYYNNRSYADYPSCSQIQQNFDDKNAKYCSMQNFDCAQYTAQQQSFENQTNYEKSDIFNQEINLTDVFPQQGNIQNIPFYSESSNNDSDIVVEESEEDFIQKPQEQAKGMQRDFMRGENVEQQKIPLESFLGQKEDFQQKNSIEHFSQRKSSIIENFPLQKSSIENFEQQKNSLENFQQQKNSLENFQQHKNSLENFQQHKNSLENFQQHKNSLENFQQQKNSLENFQQHKNSLENFQQQKNSLENFQQHKNSLENCSLQKSSIENFQQHKNSLENCSLQKSSIENFQQQKNSLENFQQHKKSLEHFSLPKTTIENSSLQNGLGLIENYTQQKNSINFPQQKTSMNCFPQHKNLIDNFLQLKAPVETFSQPRNSTETFPQQKSSMENFAQRKRSAGQKELMESFMQQQQIGSFIQQENPMECFSRAKNVQQGFPEQNKGRQNQIKSFLQQNILMEGFTQQKNVLDMGENVDSREQMNFDYLSLDKCGGDFVNQEKTFDYLPCQQKFVQQDNSEVKNFDCLRKENSSLSQQKGREGSNQFQQQGSLSNLRHGDLLQQNKFLGENLLQQNKILGEKLLEQNKISRGNLEHQNLLQQNKILGDNLEHGIIRSTAEGNHTHERKIVNYSQCRNIVEECYPQHKNVDAKFCKGGEENSQQINIGSEKALQRNISENHQQESNRNKKIEDVNFLEEAIVEKFPQQNKVHKNVTVAKVNEHYSQQAKNINLVHEREILEESLILQKKIVQEKFVQNNFIFQSLIPNDYNQGKNIQEENFANHQKETVEEDIGFKGSKIPKNIEDFQDQDKFIENILVNEKFQEQDKFVQNIQINEESQMLTTKYASGKFEEQNVEINKNLAQNLTNGEFDRVKFTTKNASGEFEEQNIQINKNLAQNLTNGGFDGKFQLREKNVKCVICQIPYSLGGEFYALTEKTPVATSSRKPFFQKLKHFLETECNSENYLCEHCLALVNTIDHLETKLWECKTKFYTKIKKSNVNLEGKKITGFCEESCDCCPNSGEFLECPRKDAIYKKNEGNTQFLKRRRKESEFFECKRKESICGNNEGINEFCKMNKENLKTGIYKDFCKSDLTSKGDTNSDENCEFCKSYKELLKLKEKHGDSNKCKSCENVRIETNLKHKNFLCEICGKAFLRVRTFKMHLKIHSKKIANKKNQIDAFVCGICKKLFRTRSNLKEHQSYCSGLLNYRCKMCAKKFATRTKLKNHVRLKHDKKFTSICSICNIGFVKVSAYKSHMISHCSEKKFSCTVCGKFYKTKSNLKFHMKFHEKKLPFNCMICQKGFMRKEYLESHMSSHTGERNFACASCKKSFISQKNLDAHMKLHDGSVKKKTCNVCGKLISKGMEDHMRTHANLKEFECDSCELRFNTKGALLKHKKRKHNEESVES